VLGRPYMELFGSWQHEVPTDQRSGRNRFVKVKWTTEGGETGALRSGAPTALATHVKELSSVHYQGLPSVIGRQLSAISHGLQSPDIGLS
jgi:hypothetical protein